MFVDKGLVAYPDKTCFIVCGSKKYKQNVMEDLKRNALMFGNFNIKQREYDRYLGQILHGDGLDQSAEATVKERSGRIKGATMEIKGIIEEFAMQAIGGSIAAWEQLRNKNDQHEMESLAGKTFAPSQNKTPGDNLTKQTSA